MCFYAKKVFKLTAKCDYTNVSTWMVGRPAYFNILMFEKYSIAKEVENQASKFSDNGNNIQKNISGENLFLSKLNKSELLIK